MLKKQLPFFLLCCTLFYFPLFLKLDYLPFRSWDEARPAVHAYEMYRSHKYLVTTYEAQPDLWYSKPPLLVWLQVLCIHVFGYNELAIRLPVALAALGTCFLMMGFLRKTTGSRWMGLMAGLVLVTTAGYVSIHGTRTGDVDVLLTFFLTLSAFSFYGYTEHPERKKYLYLFFLGLAGGVLSKSVAGLFLLPAIGLFALQQKVVMRLLKDKHFYVGIGLFLLLPGLYYALREQATPGYLAAVWRNEWLGRYNETVEGHKHGFWYYYERIKSINFLLWVCLLPIGVGIGLFGSDTRWRKVIGYCLLLAVSYFLIISCSQTKTYWYDIPLYPFWAVLVAMAIYHVYFLLAHTLGQRAAAYLFLIMVFCMPYKLTFDRVARRGEPYEYDEAYYNLSLYLRDAVHGHKTNLDQVRIITETYYGQYLPYVYLLDEQKQHLSVVPRVHDIHPGDKVLVHMPTEIRKVDSLYTYTVLDSFENVKLYQIRERK